jgi:hypothetical protein
VRSSFEEFIETNLMVQSEFNLIFWFMSYNIFFIVEQVGPALVRALSLLLSLTPNSSSGAVHADSGRPGNPLEIANAGLFYRIEERVAYPGAAFFTL